VDTTESTAGQPAAESVTVSGGLTVTRTARTFDPAELTRVATLVDRRRGGVLSAGLGYPRPYTRWHIAYV
jgi:anthranilate synthase